MCETYAAAMAVDIRRISVAIRECGDGAVWPTGFSLPSNTLGSGAMLGLGSGCAMQFDNAPAQINAIAKIIGVKMCFFIGPLRRSLWRRSW